MARAAAGLLPRDAPGSPSTCAASASPTSSCSPWPSTPSTRPGLSGHGLLRATSRFGTPDDFKFLVDTLHQAGIGVILDWVPGHFPRDDYSLRRFDGTALYEHEDPRLGEHPDWGR